MSLSTLSVSQMRFGSLQSKETLWTICASWRFALKQSSIKRSAGAGVVLASLLRTSLSRISASLSRTSTSLSRISASLSRTSASLSRTFLAGKGEGEESEAGKAVQAEVAGLGEAEQAKEAEGSAGGSGEAGKFKESEAGEAGEGSGEGRGKGAEQARETG